MTEKLYRVEVENDPYDWQVYKAKMTLADANHLADSLENVNPLQVRVVVDE